MSKIKPSPEFGYGQPFVEPEPEPERSGNGDLDANTTAAPEPVGEPEPAADAQHVMTVVAVFAGIIGFLIMLENIVVLITVLKGKPKQRRSLSYFIGNIAAADFVAGFHLVWFLCFDFFFISIKPVMYIIVMCSLWLVTIVVSVIGLFSFAIFRLKLAKSVESYYVSRKAAILTIILSWTLPIALLVIAPIAGWNCISCPDGETRKQKCSQLLYPFTKNYAMMLAVLVLSAIFGLIVIYMWILHAVHQKVHKLQKKTNIKKKEKQLIHSVLIILFLFTISILPVAVCLFVDYTSLENKLLQQIFPVVVLVSFSNSICNPFIYIWRLPAMNHALWRVLGRKGIMPDSSSFKEMVLWKISTKGKNRSKTGSPKTKFGSQSSDKMSRKFTTSIVDTNTNIQI